MADPEGDTNQVSFASATWNAREAYPMIANTLHSTDFITIAAAVQRIGVGLYGDGWLSSDEAKCFPLGLQKGRYFKLVKNLNYPKKAKAPTKRIYLDDIEAIVLKGAYQKFKEIRNRIKLAIDEESFRVAIGDGKRGIVEIHNKYYLIRNLNYIVATGRIRQPNYDDGDPLEIVLVNATDFDAWFGGPSGGKKEISVASINEILNEVNASMPENDAKLRKIDLTDVFDEVRHRGFNITDNRISEKLWKKVDPRLKVSHAPGKDAEQFAKGKAKLKEIVESVLGLSDGNGNHA